MASDIQNIAIFSKSGMDQDTDIIGIKAGDSRYRLNVTLSEDTNFEIISNIKGNTLRSYTLPAGTNIVKGFVEDKENKAGIYFIWNSNNDHCIIRFNSEDNSFTEILTNEDVILPAWGAWSGYADAQIIGDEESQFLIWCDGGAPKMINVQYAIDNNYNSPITEEEISFYKYPLIVGSGNTTISANYLAGTGPNTKIHKKLFQGAIRLKYYDKTYSVLSNYSEIPVPTDNIPSGRLTNDWIYGIIRFSFNIQNEPIIVDKYQFIYRIIDIGGGVAGNWNIYDEFDYSAKGDYSVDFKNDKTLGVLADSEAIRPYDFVPDKSNHVGIIDSNRAVFDVAQEGYDNVDLNVSMAVREDAITFGFEGVKFQQRSLINSAGTSSVIVTVLSIDENDDYSFWFRISDYSFQMATLGLTPTEVGDAIKNYFDNLFSGLGIAYFTITNTSTANSVILTVATTDPNNHIVSALVQELSGTFRSLKTGATYKFGLEYGYSGKRGTVQTNNDMILEVPDFKDLSATFTDYTLNAELTINHVAPTDATDFRIVCYYSDVDYYEEYLLHYNTSDIYDDSAEYTMFLDDSYTIIRKDDMINRMRLAYGDETQSIEYGFDIQTGDVIKFVGHFTNKTTVIGLVSDVQILDIGEYTIDVVTDTEIKISSSAIREVENKSGLPLILIQIIRKKETFDYIAQEFSPNFPISEHSGTIDITEFFADCFKSRQVYLNLYNEDDYGFTGATSGNYAWMEKPRMSLYYDSYPKSQGRENAYNPNAAQVSSNKIQWGGKWIDEGGVNFLTKFDAEDYRDLDDRNGKITKIQQIGDVLRVYQERKVTSFYLKTTSSIDADGNSTFVFDSSVMSDGRQFIEDYGCTHFSSYVKNVRNAYFFDLINSAVLRDSANGLQVISDYGMHSYFKEKVRQIVEYSGSGTIEIFGGWDEDQEMYLITFVNIVSGAKTTSVINETIGFQENTNRWISFFSFIPEFYGKISGDQLLSFTAGALYEHNTNAVRNNFYGVQYYSEVWVHGTEQPMINKIFDSIEINSDGQWSCPDDDSIEIERPIVMQSRLLPGKFRIQEGIYRADFLRDALNGGAVWTRSYLLNGRQLRGKEITVKLRNTDTGKALLETVIINSSISQ